MTMCRRFLALSGFLIFRPLLALGFSFWIFWWSQFEREYPLPVSLLIASVTSMLVTVVLLSIRIIKTSRVDDRSWKDYWNVGEISWLILAFLGVLAAMPKYSENFIHQAKALVGERIIEERTNLNRQLQFDIKLSKDYQKELCLQDSSGIFAPICGVVDAFLLYAQSGAQDASKLDLGFTIGNEKPYGFIEGLSAEDKYSDDKFFHLSAISYLIAMLSPNLDELESERNEIRKNVQKLSNSYWVTGEDKLRYVESLIQCQVRENDNICRILRSAISSTDYDTITESPETIELVRKLGVAKRAILIFSFNGGFARNLSFQLRNIEALKENMNMMDDRLGWPSNGPGFNKLAENSGLKPHIWNWLNWLWKAGAFSPVLLGSAFGIRFSRALAAFRMH